MTIQNGDLLMNLSRQISRRFGQATGTRIRSVVSDCIVGLYRLGLVILRCNV